MFDELDIVSLTRSLPEKGLRVRATGTVHMLLGVNPLTYLVEFSETGLDGQVEAVLGEDLEMVTDWSEVLAQRRRETEGPA